MKTSYQWLKTYVDLPEDPAEYMKEMIRTGTTVESVEPLAGELSGVVVGRVLSCVKHENSDHLHVCMVDVGKEAPLQIVCGAPNVKEGLLVPVALVGATLPGGHTIKEGKLRGVLSSGMLCSSTELKIPQELYPSVGEEGLMIFHEDYAPGTDIKTILGLDDTVVDVEILANRPDQLSVLGMARESAAVFDRPFKMPSLAFKEAGGDIHDYIKIRVEDSALCPRYAARVIRNVKIVPSPLWLRAYLHAAGMRSINNIVDITNFIMLETGHPMHAFDLSHVRGGEIIVRQAKPGEALTTLDEKEHQLRGGELLICDAEGPTGLAGIMGGLDSEITEGTKDILFECASFDRGSTRVTARSLGIRTESSGRFERGVSPKTVLTALSRACHMVDELGAGEVVSGLIDIYPDPLPETRITASVSRINARTGVVMTGEEMQRLLTRLHFQVMLEGDEIRALAPDFRQDMEQEADICEEVLRLGGYDRIPATRLRGETTPGGESQSRIQMKRAAKVLQGLGYDEIMNFSFFSQKQLDLLRLPENDPRLDCVRIRNPLGEDTALMRTTLIPDMLKVLALNMHRGNDIAMLYEFGTLFDNSESTHEGLPVERPALSLGSFGGGSDFYTIRDAVLTLLDHFGLEPDIEKAQEPFLHPGRSAIITAQGKKIATVGEVHPDVADSLDLTEKAYVADIDLETLWSLSQPMGQVKELPRTPAVSRDIALVLPDAQPLLPVINAIRRAGGELMEAVSLFDVYRGQQLGEGMKSAAFALTLRAKDRTLEEKDIQTVMDKVQRSVKMQFGAEIRS